MSVLVMYPRNMANNKTPLSTLHITGSDYYTRSSEILRSLNWINLEDRRALQFKKFMYKTANNMVPSYLPDKFIRTSSVYEYNLRGASQKLFCS